MRGITVEDLVKLKREMDKNKVIIFSHPDNKEQIEEVVKSFNLVEVKYSIMIPKDSYIMTTGEKLMQPYGVIDRNYLREGK